MTNTDFERVLHLIGLIYDAATQPDLWPDFAQRLCQVIPSTDSNIQSADVANGRIHIAFTMTPPEVIQLYFTRYHMLNPYWHRNLPDMQTGRILKVTKPARLKNLNRLSFTRSFSVTRIYFIC